MTEAAANTPYIALLAPAHTVPDGLEAAFAARGYGLRRFAEVSELSAVLADEPAAALLVQADWVAYACEALDALSRESPGRRSTTVIGLGRADPGGRLQAILHGAELFFEHLDDISLPARVLALVTRPPEEPFRVLLVDDDPSARHYLRVVLEQAGMVAEECDDPTTVPERITTLMPDLVLMDLYMPGMDGLSLTMALRQQPELAALPIVFLSGEDSDEAHFNAIQAGGDDYLVKPIRARSLIAAVRSRIRRARLVRGQLPTRASTPARSGLLRRGDFLAQLGDVLRRPRSGCEVLVAIKIDQATRLAEKLGLAGAFELEQAVSQRFATALADSDSYTLWLEYGFGVLVQRETPEAVAELAQALCRAIAAEPFMVAGDLIPLTVSVGVALPPGGGGTGDPDRWFASAYAAQAIAHRLGGNRHEGVLTQGRGGMAPERVLIIREWVKEAVNGQNVISEFQPMLPLHGDEQGLYALVAKLRDYRAPLAGVMRHEYLDAAREAGALAMIDRMSLFGAFEAIEEQRTRGRGARVLVSLDIVSLNDTQLGWLVAEARRRKEHVGGLVVELDAEGLLARPDGADIVQRIVDCGIAVSISDDSGSLSRLDRFQAYPATLLRLPYPAVQQVPANTFVDMLANWRNSHRELIVDRITSTDAVSQLWALRVSYLQGDALAAAGPRLDYDFSEFGA